MVLHRYEHHNYPIVIIHTHNFPHNWIVFGCRAYTFSKPTCFLEASSANPRRLAPGSISGIKSPTGDTTGDDGKIRPTRRAAELLEHTNIQQKHLLQNIESMLTHYAGKATHLPLSRIVSVL